MPDITISVTSAQAKRIQDAFEEALELDRPATIADVKEYIVSDLKQFVRTSERRVARDAIVDVELDI